MKVYFLIAEREFFIQTNLYNFKTEKQWHKKTI